MDDIFVIKRKKEKRRSLLGVKEMKTKCTAGIKFIIIPEIITSPMMMMMMRICDIKSPLLLVMSPNTSIYSLIWKSQKVHLASFSQGPLVEKN